MSKYKKSLEKARAEIIFEHVSNKLLSLCTHPFI